MSIKTAIKKALASVQVSVLPHENPAPAAETTVAQVVPSPPPTEEDNSRANAGEAMRIIQQLSVKDEYKLDGETRRRIIESINRGGPPRDAFQENRFTGRLSALNGTKLDAPPTAPLQQPVRVTDTASDEIRFGPDLPSGTKTTPQEVTGSKRRMARAEYLEHKRRFEEGKER